MPGRLGFGIGIGLRRVLGEGFVTLPSLIPGDATASLATDGYHTVMYSAWGGRDPDQIVSDTSDLGIMYDEAQWGGKSLGAHKASQTELFTGTHGVYIGGTVNDLGGGVYQVIPDAPSANRGVYFDADTIVVEGAAIATEFTIDSITGTDDLDAFTRPTTGGVPGTPSSVWGKITAGSSYNAYSVLYQTQAGSLFVDTGATGTTEFQLSGISLKSIDGSHIHQYTGADYPTYNEDGSYPDGNKRITFDGVSDHLVTAEDAAAYITDGGGTIGFAVSASPGVDEVLYAEGDLSSDTPTFRLASGAATASKLRVFARDDANATYIDFTTADDVFDGSSHTILLEFDWAGETVTVYIDGTEETNSPYAFAATPGTITTDVSSIAARVGATTDGYWAGDINVRVYLTDSLSAVIADVTEALNYKWGATIALALMAGGGATLELIGGGSLGVAI